MTSARLFLPLEQLLNRNLKASITARRAARELEGRSLDIGLQAAEPLARLRVEQGLLRFGMPEDAAADVTLTAGWRRLLELLGGDDAGPGLDLRGDPAVAEGFARLLRHSRPGPEEELARLAGDRFARQAGDAARAASRWAGGAGASVRRNVRDFVQEEARLSPTRVEFEAFAEKVERLRDAAGRVAARVSAMSEGRGR